MYIQRYGHDISSYFLFQIIDLDFGQVHEFCIIAWEAINPINKQ